MPQTVNIDGVGTVHFPDDFTPAQIQSAIETDILPQAQSTAGDAPAPAQGQVSAPKPDLLHSINRGITDTGDRAAQLWMDLGAKLGLKGYGPGVAAVGQQAPTLADIGTQQMNAQQQQYDQSRGPNAGIDWGRMGGNALSTAPVGAIGGPEGMLGKIGIGMLQGGVAGAAQYDPTNSLAGTAKDTGLGAAAGGIAAPIASAAGSGVSATARFLVGRVRGAIASLGGDASEAAITKAVPELAGVPDAARADLIKEAQDQVSQTGNLNAEALGRKANLIAQGLTPTKGMVTRTSADWTLERNLQKLEQSPDRGLSSVGSGLTDVFKGNDQALTDRLQGASAGLPQATQEAHGQTVMAAIDDLSRGSQKDVSAVYDAVREARGEELASDARNLHSTIDDLSDSPAADPITQAAMRRLKKMGMVDPDGKLTAKTMTVTQSEGFRQFINQQPNVYGKSQIIKATDADVLHGLGDDAFAGARAGAKQRFDMLDNPSTQRALNAYGELQQGKTAQGFIQSQIVNGADQDVRSLVDTVSRMPSQQASDTMNAMRAGLLKHIQDQVINPEKKTFSGTKLSQTLRDIGDTKLVTVLGAQQTQQLKSLARAALDATVEPAYSGVNHSNTATTLLSLVRNARKIPLVPGLVTDEVQKSAERSSARSQLAQILAAGSRKPGNFDPAALAQALQKYSPAAAGAAIGQARQPQQ